MIKALGLTTLLALAFSSLACGKSPLLNHETASTASANNAAELTPPAHTPTGTCALEFPKSGLCASLTWQSALSSEEENVATLRFWDKASGSEAGPYRDVDGEAALLLWMPSMGHGSSPVTVTPQGAGIYSVSRIYFVMPGEWDIRIQIKKNHQLFEQAVLSVKL